MAAEDEFHTWETSPSLIGKVCCFLLSVARPPPRPVFVIAAAGGPGSESAGGGRDRCIGQRQRLESMRVTSELNQSLKVNHGLSKHKLLAP